jgi:hypothetical protein
VNLPADRHLDPRWNSCMDLLTETWNRLGPDFTLSWLRMSARAQVDAYGMVQMQREGARQVRDSKSAATGTEG